VKRAKHAAAATAFLTVAVSGTMAQAAFHLWTFTEFFSNEDGSVQFVELHSPANNEHFADGAEIRSTSTGQVFTFPGDLSSSQTANRHLLIATADFGSLPGGVTPDYTLPESFFDSDGDTVSLFSPLFGEFHSRTFSSVPIDGVTSRHFPSNTLAENSPTNFDGATGSVDLTAPPSFPADFDGDGDVDADDLTQWHNDFAQNSGSDADGDGDSDGHDFLAWQRQFGSGQASAAVSVPEPASWVLLTATVICMLWSRTSGSVTM